MKELAVIILNWNGRKLLEEFLPTAVKHTSAPEVQLFVADNGSTDDSLEWLTNNFPEVKTLVLEKNYGFAEGYNRAIEMTRFPYTILLNSDVEVTENWWQPLLKFMKENPEAGACQPKIKSYHNTSLFEYAGAAGGLIDNLGYPYCRGRLFDILDQDNGQYDYAPERIAWASGAALMVDTDTYLSLGGLDPLFFAHMEEIDLCLRMQGAGKSVWFVPGSEIYHVGGASLEAGNPKKTYLNFRNNLLMLHKNLPSSKGRRVLFFRRLADTLAFFMFIVKADMANARAILKAHNDFRVMKKNYTQLPEKDYYSSLPGVDRSALIMRYLKNPFKKK